MDHRRIHLASRFATARSGSRAERAGPTGARATTGAAATTGARACWCVEAVSRPQGRSQQGGVARQRNGAAGDGAAREVMASTSPSPNPSSPKTQAPPNFAASNSLADLRERLRIEHEAVTGASQCGVSERTAQ